MVATLMHQIAELRRDRSIQILERDEAVAKSAKRVRRKDLLDDLREHLSHASVEDSPMLPGTPATNLKNLTYR